jgi:hypothetical protein
VAPGSEIQTTTKTVDSLFDEIMLQIQQKIVADVATDHEEMISEIEKSNYKQLEHVISDITTSEFMQRNARISVDDMNAHAEEAEKESFGN